LSRASGSADGGQSIPYGGAEQRATWHGHSDVPSATWHTIKRRV